MLKYYIQFYPAEFEDHILYDSGNNPVKQGKATAHIGRLRMYNFAENGDGSTDVGLGHQSVQWLQKAMARYIARGSQQRARNRQEGMGLKGFVPCGKVVGTTPPASTQPTPSIAARSSRGRRQRLACTTSR